MKLWDKGSDHDQIIEQFTIGKDRELDIELAEYDVKGSIAHAKMLHQIGILSPSELNDTVTELEKILEIILLGKFKIEDGVEDVHSQIEYLLTTKLGATGKKIHTARSRNDQVMLDIRMMFRDRITGLIHHTKNLARAFLSKSNAHKEALMPGYTHSQIAMVSSFGLWFGSYAEALIDDIFLLKSALKITNKNPLGSAAGYGSSFPIDRQLTTQLLDFDDLCYNSIYAQFGRGKIELTVSHALSSLAYTLSRFASDICLFCSRNYGFIELPDSMTTGSSIMPHKKNPDVFELIRARCHLIGSAPVQVRSIISNLMTGYHRDYQLLKEVMFPALHHMDQILQIMNYCLPDIRINAHILDDSKYDEIFSVETVNELVNGGTPFRDAYRMIAEQMKSGQYRAHKEITHTHIGSLGNLANEQIAKILEGL